MFGWKSRCVYLGKRLGYGGYIKMESLEDFKSIVQSKEMILDRVILIGLFFRLILLESKILGRLISRVCYWDDPQ